jgi:hypothetical protein
VDNSKDLKCFKSGYKKSRFYRDTQRCDFRPLEDNFLETVSSCKIIKFKWMGLVPLDGLVNRSC